MREREGRIYEGERMITHLAYKPFHTRRAITAGYVPVSSSIEDSLVASRRRVGMMQRTVDKVE